MCLDVWPSPIITRKGILYISFADPETLDSVFGAAFFSLDGCLQIVGFSNESVIPKSP